MRCLKHFKDRLSTRNLDHKLLEQELCLGFGLSMVSRIFECPINVENKSHVSSSSASSNHLGRCFAYGFKARLLGGFSCPLAPRYTPSFRPLTFPEVCSGNPVKVRQSLMMSSGLVTQSDCTLWNHPVEAFPNKETKQKRPPATDVSLKSSPFLALDL